MYVTKLQKRDKLITWLIPSLVVDLDSWGLLFRGTKRLLLRPFSVFNTTSIAYLKYFTRIFVYRQNNLIFWDLLRLICCFWYTERWLSIHHYTRTVYGLNMKNKQRNGLCGRAPNRNSLETRIQPSATIFVETAFLPHPIPMYKCESLNLKL